MVKSTKKQVIVAPSIIAADFMSLKHDLTILEQIGLKWVHIDVMDGHFVPNITLGPAIIKSMRKETKLFFDVHLMITDPQNYWQEFQKAGADLITFHSEITADKNKLIKNIKSSGVKASISIKPATPVSDIENLLEYLDAVLVMTVEPGFSGQSFMEEMTAKISALRSLIDKNKYSCMIEIDGGINFQTARVCIDAGADALVSGSYIFEARNLKAAVESISV